MKVPNVRTVLLAAGGAPRFLEQFNLRRVYYWLGLSGLVGVVGGVGALAFKWMIDVLVPLFWGRLVGYTPEAAGGEPWPFAVLPGPPKLLGLIVAPAIGGLVSAFLVYRFAPEAEGHGTDAAIRAYHRDRGRIRSRIPIVKMLASAFTLASGGSAGREGPIAQIGAGFGSVLGGWLKLSDRERRILLAAGVAAGIGAIFRAPLAGALFAAEVLYGEPDIEAEVVVPALLSSIVSYNIFCAVHGYGHLFSGTRTFDFHDPRALGPYAVLGVVTAFGSVAFVTTFNAFHGAFKRLEISRYVKPAIGGALTGITGIILWKVTHDRAALAVMGSGYGTLQKAVSETGALGPSLAVLTAVALGKIVTTSFTIGSGGSGGVFGPSVVIGGALGGLVGTLFHLWFPHVVPDVGPFTIVGMAGFFAGAAKAPISTVLMVSDMTGNYSLLLPSMLVVGMSMIIAHRWTIYPEQVRTRAESPAHRGEFLRDVLSDLRVGAVFDRERAVKSVSPEAKLQELMELVATTQQQTFPIVDDEQHLVGFFSLDQLREILFTPGLENLIVAKDLAREDVPAVGVNDDVQRALDLLALRNLAELPVVSDEDEPRLVGIVSRADVIAAYNARLGELREDAESTRVGR